MDWCIEDKWTSIEKELKDARYVDIEQNECTWGRKVGYGTNLPDECRIYLYPVFCG